VNNDDDAQKIIDLGMMLVALLAGQARTAAARSVCMMLTWLYPQRDAYGRPDSEAADSRSRRALRGWSRFALGSP
jgi:hypothetical protein